LLKNKKKMFPNTFIPEYWNNVILAARKKHPFKTICMDKNDFYSLKKIGIQYHPQKN